MIFIDLNCDMGEGGRRDADIMPLISSCNIACGGHAGDETTIAQTIELALTYQVNVGAHPSYPDKANFGRKSFRMEAGQLKDSLQEQIEKVHREIQKQGGELHHVKPHGALYNELVTDKEKAALVVDAVSEIESDLLLFVPPHSIIKTLAEQKLSVWVEGFADRRYEENFSLTSRSKANAVLHNEEKVFNQVLNMVKYDKIVLENDVVLHQKFDTLCVHSDTENSADILHYLNKLLPQNNVTIGLL